MTFEEFWDKCTKDEQQMLLNLNRRQKVLMNKFDWGQGKASRLKVNMLDKLEHRFRMIAVRQNDG